MLPIQGGEKFSGSTKNQYTGGAWKKVWLKSYREFVVAYEKKSYRKATVQFPVTATCNQRSLDKNVYAQS